MSAIRDSGDAADPIQVLFTLHNQMSLLDFSGPLEVLNNALNDKSDPGENDASQVYSSNVIADTKAFDITLTGEESKIMTSAGAAIAAQIPMKEAHERLSDFDVLIVPGGAALDVLKKGAEPLKIIKDFADLQTKDPSRERTLLAIDTAALFLAKLGLLQGLGATTHPDYYIKMEKLCQEAAANDTQERTDVMEERYVVNHGRFDVDSDDEDNPYVFRKKPKAAAARKGSLARKESNARREHLVRRASMKLGGLRVITTGGPASGLDATMYLVSALVSHETAQEAARVLQYTWIKGVVVDAIDV
jgi:transcriptional regulator GlxA family with amidase domain